MLLKKVTNMIGNMKNFKLLVILFLLFIIPCSITSTQDYLDYTRTYQFSWKADENSALYIVEISTDPTFRNEEDLVYRIETEETLIQVELRVGTFYFRVAGVNERGEMGPWSEVERVIIDIPDFNNYEYNNIDLESGLSPETEASFDGFIEGEAYDDLEPVDYNRLTEPILERFGYISSELLINLFYYIAFSHYEHGDEYKTFVYYLEAEKMNRIVFKGNYEIPTTDEIYSVPLRITGSKIKYTPTRYYILDKFFIKLIDKYIQSADYYYYKGQLDIAMKLYSHILLIDPYNEHVLMRLGMR